MLPGSRPAQVGAPLQQLPHAVVWGQLGPGDVLQKHQDQHVLPLIEQTEAATAEIDGLLRDRAGDGLETRWLACLPGHLDLCGAPLALQVSATDHADGLPAPINGICDVVYDGFT